MSLKGKEESLNSESSMKLFLKVRKENQSSIFVVNTKDQQDNI